jgi:hypothetical protein
MSCRRVHTLCNTAWIVAFFALGMLSLFAGCSPRNRPELPGALKSARQFTLPPVETILPAEPAPRLQPSTLDPIAPLRFEQTFDGQPTTPAAWRPADWDLTIHSRAIETWQQLDPIAAGHGHQCEPPPANHDIHAYEEMVYLCRDHVMTALNASDYGVIYLTPNHLVDFSQGEAIIRFDLSTARTSNRDWVDIWITPYNDNLQLPLEDWLPDLSGEPRQAVHVRMEFGERAQLSGRFRAELINDFNAEPLPEAVTRGYENFLEPSPTQRETFELRISATHLRFGLPAYDLWWVDTPLDTELAWTQGVVQFGHHSYNPMKNCDACRPNTWHWDNVIIEPAVPFTILPADRRYLDSQTGPLIAFRAPAPAGAHLRFAGIGENLEVSFNFGKTWQPAQLQAQEETADEHFKSYWTPIPAGVSLVQIRGENWWGGDWHVRDISIWAPPES